MRPTASFNAGLENDHFQVLWEDGERALYRGLDERRTPPNVLALRLTAESPLSASVDRLVHEYELRDHLESAWAARPLELMRQRDRTMLLLEDPGGEPLDRHLGEPMDVPRFLQLAIGIAAVLRQVHQRGLVHKDVKPGHILVDGGNVYLTGFGLASRLPRERQPASPPEFIVGTLAYMAPEQTGRMNRSVDSRSDLYSLGVTFYQMLTGVLPFMASHPMEWIHCHVARTPVPPHHRVADVSHPISHIIMKLLAKTAEERYQTAAGVERDLKRCLAAWQTSGSIGIFLPGETDTPDRLAAPETLCGREREIASLLEAYERVATTGTSELMLVCGYSGIGKSAVVHELHKAIVPSRGLFAAGKFDQQQQDIPYRSIARAFQGLIRDFMGSRSDAELEGWRGALSEALGSHGRLVAELVPELELIIGKQPLTGDLPARQSHRLFQIALRRFVGAFAQSEHPLVLFLDDLHWADAATLDLLEELMVRSDLHHLLVIGAYRDNEVDSTHPLMRKLEVIRSSGAKVGQITLMPLDRGHLEELVGYALRCAPLRAAPLAQLIHEKTGGNPFFASRFLSTLADEGLVAFDATAGEWSWDLAQIRAQGFTENVIELMLDSLRQLPPETQNALKQLACLGNVATIAMLSAAMGTSESQVHAALWEAVRHDLVERREDSYQFVHDRVQEATYSAILPGQRAQAHLLIGRMLAAQTPAEERGESIFEIVNQLNRCPGLITAVAERQQLATFNLTAGQRAHAAAAFVAALGYCATGRELLTEDCWESQRELIFKLELHRAECELLTGAFADAENHFTSLSARATGAFERAAVARVGIDLYSLINQHSRSVGVGLDYLRHVGISLSPQPTDAEARFAYQHIWSELSGRTNAELIGLPLMTDPEALVTLDVLNRLSSPAQFTDLNVYTLATCRMLSLTLEHGNSDASAVAYSRLGMVAGRWFGEYERANRVGQLAQELVEQRGLRRFQAGVYLNFANLIMPWTRPVRMCWELIERARAAAQKAGDLMYAGICGTVRIINLFSLGDVLADMQRECENALAFMQKVQIVPGVEVVSVALATVRMLRGSTATFGTLDDGFVDERKIERDFANAVELTGSQCWYWVSKLRARFTAGDPAAALDAASHAQPRLSRSSTLMQTADYHLFTALSHAAFCNSLPAARRASHLERLASHHRQLTDWATTCPENFADRAALVGAEVARLDGNELEAERLYSQSIRSARANGFVHNEALAYELASKFYADRSLEDIAEMHMSKARNGYLRWGAHGKVRQLEALHPYLRSGPVPAPGGTIGLPVDQLDLATVIKVSQTVSSEIVLEKLINALMRTAIEQAGAERGVLVIWRDGELRCVAVGSIRNDAITVDLRDDPVAQTLLSQSIAQYVLRTRDPVILDDATEEHPFSADPYIRQRRARSVLCLPLITQAKLGGLLYLENNLAPRVFVQARAAVLKLLASQAAIALENAGLYQDVKRAEAQTREAQMELRRASDKLAQATQAASLSELSASIAHEVNQPLAAIVANSHACYRWLTAPVPNIERAKITAERITRDANSAADVVSRIRALFRRTLNPRSNQDLNELIEDVCRLMAEEIAQKDSRIDTTLEPGLPVVALDRVQVQQVFVNLIRNGIESMEAVAGAARTLQIRSCRDSSHTIRVEVRDAGAGFSEPERAFEPFFTTKQNGMGWGWDWPFAVRLLNPTGAACGSPTTTRAVQRWLSRFPGDERSAMSSRMPVAFVASLVCTTSAVAANESGEGLSEILVTAQRRQGSLQQTPISVTALTGQRLTDFGARDFADYARSVPDLSFGMGGSPFGGPAYGYSSTRQIVIRGVAGANTTSLYIDDTPIPNVVDPRVFDLEHIEVLRGPQGTLFGASSMGGTVRLITKTPDPGGSGGTVDLQAFDINAGGAGYDISGSANVALVEHNAGLRLSVFDAFDPGYFRKVFGVANIPGVDFAPGTRVAGSTKVGDTHEYGGTVSLLITPEALPGLSMTPLVVLQRFDVDGYPVADGNPGNSTQVRPLDIAERSLAQWQLYGFTAKYAATSGDLISSTGYLHRYSQDVEDGTMWFAAFQDYYYSPLPYMAARVGQTFESREITQELRFQSHLRGPLQFVTGFFYQRTSTSSPFYYLLPGLNAASGYTLGADSIANLTQNTLSKQLAGFADVSFSPLAKLELSAGVRKTRLDDTGHQVFEQSPSLNADSAYSYAQRQQPVTPRFAAKYSFDPGSMTYVSASKGFRIGGENAPAAGPCAEGARMLGLPAGVPVPYYSDSLWSYEIGLKNLWNAHKIASRAAAYYIDWKDMQQTVLLPVCGIPTFLNAGAARIIGAEWEISARVAPRLELDASLGYEDGKITAARTLSNGQVLGFPVDTPLSGVPKWTASLRASYSVATSIGAAFVRGEYSFVGSSLSLANGGTGVYRGEYSLLDLRCGLQISDWTATLFIKNVFNRAANYGDIVGAAGVVPGQTRLVVAQPRTLGLEFRRVIGSYDGG